jgi:sensor histidine kinase YesM
MKPEKNRTNGTVAPMDSPEDQQVNDIGFRLVLIPFFGIAIPLLTKMINSSVLTYWQLPLAYAYTILISFIIWQGNRYLLFALRSYFNWFNKPVKKIVALLLAITFFTIPVSILLMIGWYNLFNHGRVDWNVVFTTTLIIMICVVFITHVYETVFLVKESETDKLRNEQMQRAKAEAELEALKNQIDPHFIFNSLNTLSHLIEVKPATAKQFNDHMADVYRYILQNKARSLVLLQEEMEFLQHYFFLLVMRFEEAIQLNVDIPSAAAEQYLIPPISLQILAENAVKHNQFTTELPLNLSVKQEGESIVVQNNFHQKTSRRMSSKIGLHNLNERYKLTTGKEIWVEETNQLFTVRLPLLKIT